MPADGQSDLGEDRYTSGPVSRKRLYNGPLESYADEAISFAAHIEAALRPIIQDMGRQGYSWRDIELFVIDEARDVAADEIIQQK